jgi:hypothetical protein
MDDGIREGVGDEFLSDVLQFIAVKVQLPQQGLDPVGACGCREVAFAGQGAVSSSRSVAAVLGSLPRFVRQVFARVGLLALSGDQRDAEILALRHQIHVLRRHVARPRFTDTDRRILAMLSQALDRCRLSEVLLIVQPGHRVGLAPPPRRRARRCAPTPTRPPHRTRSIGSPPRPSAEIPRRTGQPPTALRTWFVMPAADVFELTQAGTPPQRRLPSGSARNGPSLLWPLFVPVAAPLFGVREHR